MEFCCSRCKMTFRSSLLLDKHKEKFCIGGEFIKTQEPETPLDMLERVRELQRRRQELRRRTEDTRRVEGGQGVKDRHTPEEKPHTGTLRPVPYRNTHSEPSGRAWGGLGSGLGGPDSRTRSEDHTAQLTQLTHQNPNLERQRRDMGQRQMEMSAHSRRVSELEKMLCELTLQEHRNTHLLETLLENLQQPSTQTLRGTVPSRHRYSRAHTPQEHPRHPPQEDPRHPPQALVAPGDTHTYVPVYGGAGLSAEISCLRLTYLQHGGCEVAILAQLQDMLDEALKLEGNQRIWPHTSQPQQRDRSKSRKPEPRRGPSLAGLSRRELWEVEEENRRLQEEILLAQLRRSRRPTRGLSDHHLSAMKMDLDLLKHEMEIQKMRRQMLTSKTPGSPLRFPPLVQVRSETPALQHLSLEASEDLDPAPYDPMAGLVVFYDCVLGLSPDFRVCRLEVSLSSGDQELSSPTPLPPAHSQPVSLSALPPLPQQSRGSMAIFATRQAVPMLLPSSSISLGLQLQASGGYDTCGQEVRRLVPRGWSKVDLFDKHNRVLSGRWKVLVRVLPVRPGLTSREINTIPQLDRAELYLRVVNARDADSQSCEVISLSSMGLYRYPPLISERSTHLDPSQNRYQARDQCQAQLTAFPPSFQQGDPGEPEDPTLLSYLQD
ncbi:coiled-coil domain-containing protein 17-like [Osmerus eperlanus]|uniref:coiled-coil domain-containing protein 17-like n=1 Tax=Osmerus eperlanus TaxID=29151 RepID=UPI002E105220